MPGGGAGGTRMGEASRPGPADAVAGEEPGGAPAGADRPRGGPAGRSLARRRGLVVLVAGGLLAGVAWALLGSSLLVVRHIEVTGNGRIPAVQVRAASDIRSGTPLARLDTTAAARRVERLGQVLSARVSRSWPDSVVITVRPRRPALLVAASGGFELVDPYGVVVRTVADRPAGLPLLRQPPAELRGNPAVHAAARVLAELPGAVRRRVLAVTAPTADEVTLHLRGRITVRWGGTGRAAVKARELAVLLRTHARFYDVSSPGAAVTSG